ncbi:DNA-binding response regulator [Actinoplanes philippinensis]|uniref:DNA-binding response regulator n=1 Tax=Actinoplanes philippinensis TaxID=35752 RepID=UPI0033DF9C9E
MAVEVAVVDPLPIFRHGAAGILTEAGHVVRTPRDVLTWARRTPEALILLTVLSDTDWTVLGRLTDEPIRHPVIAVVDAGMETLGVRAVRSGARSVILRQSGAAALIRAVVATLDGQSVLPASVTAALAAGRAAGPASAAAVTEQQISWLRALAAGSTVADLAGRSGYSERAMFRLLRGVYRELQAGSRVEALIRAKELGWL